VLVGQGSPPNDWRAFCATHGANQDCFVPHLEALVFGDGIDENENGWERNVAYDFPVGN
jgi:hypothetical protein